MRFTECKHKRLTFGSGAYHVICMDCQTFWNQSTPVVNNSLVYMQDLRVEPEDETIKDREADPCLKTTAIPALLVDMEMECTGRHVL